MTQQELQDSYSHLSIQDLLNITDRKFEYTESAVTTAIQEISKRNISEDDIKNFKIEKIN